MAAWVIFCAFCSCLGWSLSLLHQLNAAGYLVSFAAAFLLFLLWRWNTGAQFNSLGPVSKWRRRFSRAFPLGFLIVGGLAFLGGMLHPPTNYDGLAYRTPRVLHWLAEGRWHWIHTDFHRLNTRGCAIEWLLAPIYALARTNRFEFLINTVSFVLLPGRIFSIWTRIGVRPRVAWWWMWLLPSGYGYLLQAGSSANDLFGALLALVAIEFALRARRSGRAGELLIATLAAGLMTSGKAFNLLLGLPWIIAAGPALWLYLKRPVLTAVTIAAAAASSLLPTAVLNYKYCGDWTGQKAEHLVVLGSPAPAFHIEVNSALLLLQNFEPPIFPLSAQWEDFVKRTVSPALSNRLHEGWEPGAAKLEIVEMQMEEGAGLGVGVSVLVVITLVYRWRFRDRRDISRGDRIAGLFAVKWLVPLGAWAGTLVFMAQTGLSCPARYLLPFYPLLIGPVLAGNGALSQMLRRNWWRWLGIAVFAVAGVLTILTPPRPLWPALTICKALGADQSTRPMVRRAWDVYSVYADRADAFGPAIAILPRDANPLGMVTSDDPEGALWQPFGSRRIEHLCKEDGPEYLRARNIKYVLASSYVVTHIDEMSQDAFLKKYNAELVQPVTLFLRAHYGHVEWWLVKVRD